MDRQTRLMETSLGNQGSKAITGVVAVTPTAGNFFTCLQVIEDAQVSAQTDVDIVNADLSTITTIPAGQFIYGKWKSITLTSGSMIGYYEKPL